MKDNYLSKLEGLQVRYPSVAAQFSEFADLYERKLWHQLTTRLEECLNLPEFRKGDLLIHLYKEFIEGFAHKINLLKLAHIAVTTAQQYKDPEDAIAFVNDVIKQLDEAKQPKSDEPRLYLQMQVAQYKLQQGSIQECKKLVEEGRELLDSLTDVDPSVSAAVHYVASLYHKQQKNFAEFYKSSLLYLAFISSESLPTDIKLSLAVDISLAALLGENIYNFGELLLHPIITVLDSSPYAWLHEMLECFNHGDLHAYDALCARHAAALNAQPALVENERRLREKITILCLMELIFQLPAEERTISLDTVAERTKLTLDGVEFLLMKTLSLHLIEGIIDQVDNTVQVSWVQPRVLTLRQMEGLRGRLDGWIAKVSSAALSLEEESVGVLE